LKRRKHKYVLLLLDWVVVNFAYALALKLHTSRDIDVVFWEPPFVAPEVMFFVVYSVFILLIFQMNQLYKINVYLSITRQLQYLAKALFYSAIGIALLSFFTKSKIIVDSRLVLLCFLIGAFTLLVILRIMFFRTLFKIVVTNGLFSRSVLIVGVGPRGKRLGTNLTGKNPFGLRLAGFLDDEKPAGSDVIGDIKVLGSTTDVVRVVEDHRIDEIVVCLEPVTDERFLEILDLCARTRAQVMVGSQQFSVIPQHMNQESYGDVPVFGVMNAARAMAEPFLKRILDPVAALVALIILSPLLLATAVAIKLDSRGPVLYKASRVGRNGCRFSFYKFRSMVVGSDGDKQREEQLRRFIGEGIANGTGSTKIVDERKITRVGRFIRKTSIDELPQLLNVVKGEMSLVGPRPCIPYEWENYAAWHKRRLSVMPGCTGVWQVLGRSEVGFRDMVILDLFYVYNISFHLDVWLMLKTIPVMLFGAGGK